MRFSRRLRPPRHLLALFFGAALVPTIALGWLGWRLIEQDRDLERQRIQERLEHAADLIGARLKQDLSGIEEQLAVFASMPVSQLEQKAAGYAGTLGDDTLIVIFRPGGMETYPRRNLAYHPYLPPWKERDAAVFAAGEFLEFRKSDTASAAAAFRKLTQSRDPEIRAGALLRLARNLRKSGAVEEALEVYSKLAELGPTIVAGLPAELVARHARCSLLNELNRRDALKPEAKALNADLSSGHWLITRAGYRFYKEEVRRWLDFDSSEGAIPAREMEALARAAAVESMWEEWLRIRRGEAQASGRRSHWAYERSVLLLWRGSPERVVALAADAGRLWSQGPVALRDLAGSQGVSLAVTDVGGHCILGRFPAAGMQQAIRTAVDTQLPWTLHVSSSDPQAVRVALADRRRLLVAGMAMMAVLVLTGSYFMARGFSREVAVARLQSDFVAAVSHEFRSPLTCMRQLTDMLARDRVPNDQRRRQYYEVLSHETSRLHRLVEGLLNFGRMEAGALEYRFAHVDASQLARTVVADFQKEAGGRGYRIEFAADESGSAIRADKEAFELVLWNLLDNAMKYSPECRTIWLRVARHGSAIEIQVRDRGVGIPADELKEIFKKFVRGKAAKNTSVKGTGIGLTMAQRIVEAHGGRIRVDSEPGRGSTFTILMPAEG